MKKVFALLALLALSSCASVQTTEVSYTPHKSCQIDGCKITSIHHHAYFADLEF